MSRAASIPAHLHVAILNRWLGGASASAIAEWIEQTNHQRSTPVHTSRASIQRCIKATAESDAAGSRLACVQRVRSRAPELLDALEDVDRGFREALAELKTSGKPIDTKVINSTGALLSRRNVAIHRELRLCGLTGPSADALEAKHRDALRQAQDDIRLQNDRTRARFAPEGVDAPGVPVSNSPETQPIVESIRADVEPVAANEQVDLTQPFEAVLRHPDAVPVTANRPESEHLVEQLIGDSIRADRRSCRAA